jgi:PAS domain S-box-containing protein
MNDQDELLRYFFNHATDMMCVAGFDGYFKLVNPAWSRVLGWSTEEMLARPWMEFVHPDDIEATSSVGAKIVNGEILYTFENRYLCKDGSYRWLQWSSNPSKIDPSMFGVARDITEFKDSEKRISENEEQLVHWRNLMKYVIEHFSGAVAVHDRDLNYIYVSQRYLNDYQIKHQDVIGKHHYEIFPDLPQKWRDVHQRVLKGEVVRADLDKYQKSDGSFEWTRWECRPWYEADGSIGGLIVYTEMTTEQQQNLQRITGLLELKEHQNSRLRNFTHIVSHNLRSHTANMQGLFSLLEMEEPDMARNQYVDLIRQSAVNLRETIDHLSDVLDISLSGSEGKKILDLRKTVADVMQSVAALAASEGVSMINDVHEGTTVAAVPAYLQSTVLNMLTNAIKFKSGERKSYVKVFVQPQQDGFCVLSFEDNGRGIDMERHAERLFGMYKTFHGHHDSKGLGLFITRNQIESMGGRIEVESEVEKGTTFRVYLPVE